VVVDNVVRKVSEVEARSALIQLTPPTVNSAELIVEVSEFQYELSLSDKRDGSYTVMYRSVAHTISALLPLWWCLYCNEECLLLGIFRYTMSLTHFSTGMYMFSEIDFIRVTWHKIFRQPGNVYNT